MCWQWRRWALPFVVIGANSIFAYMCWQLGSGVFRSAAEVFWAVCSNTCPLPGTSRSLGRGHRRLWLLLWYLRRNKTFIRVKDST